MSAVQLDIAQAAVLASLDTALGALFTGGAEYPPATILLKSLTGYAGLINAPGGDARPLARDAFRIALISLMTQAVTWVTPTLVNSWANLGGAYEVAGYYKDALGWVKLQGGIGGGTGGTVITTLPTGYRPLHTQIFVVAMAGGTANITVDSAGVVTMVLPASGAVAAASLAGITFKSA